MKIYNRKLANYLVKNYPDKPSGYTKYIFNSFFKKSEKESMFALIMRCLAERGNVFRELGWEEYFEWRNKPDLVKKHTYFEEVLPYTTSHEGAALIASGNKYLEFIEPVDKIQIYVDSSSDRNFMVKDTNLKKEVLRYFDDSKNYIKNRLGKTVEEYFDDAYELITYPVYRGKYKPLYDEEKGIWGWKPKSEDYQLLPALHQNEPDKLFIVYDKTWGYLEVFGYTPITFNIPRFSL